MYSKDKILEVMHDIKSEADSIKPYVTILQPRRNKAETAAQNLDGYEGLHIDMLGYSHGFLDVSGEKVDVARNYLLESSLTSGAKYALFAGEDTVLPYDGFLKLHETAESNPDAIIVGVYYMKMSSPMIMVRENDRIIPADVTPGQVYEAWQTGMDAMLMPMSILQAMKDDDPELPFCCIGYQLPGIPFIGEDNFFVHRLRACGFRLLVNTDVQCLHVDLASGKYTAHPSVDLKKYYTNFPITEPLTLADKAVIDKRWVDRLPGAKLTDHIKPGVPLRLNLGSGMTRLDGFINIDLRSKTADVQMDVSSLGLPENTVDEIYASHLVEHLNPYHIKDILSGWYSALKPGAKISLKFPDIGILCQQYLDGDDEGKNLATACIYGAMNMDGGKPDDLQSPHLWGYSARDMEYILTGAGFVNVSTSNDGFNCTAIGEKP